MGKKRETLIEGEYDQITTDCPRMSKRFQVEVMRDIGAWLLMQWDRHAERSIAARAATHPGNEAWAAGVIDDAQKCCAVVQDLFDRLSDKWSVKDWHTAQSMLDTMLAARDPAGKSLTKLGSILTSPRALDDGPPDGPGGSGVAIDAGIPPGGAAGG